jgi:hypothetical protein
MIATVFCANAIKKKDTVCERYYLCEFFTKKKKTHNVPFYKAGKLFFHFISLPFSFLLSWIEIIDFQGIPWQQEAKDGITFSFSSSSSSFFFFFY